LQRLKTRWKRRPSYPSDKSKGFLLWQEALIAYLEMRYTRNMFKLIFWVLVLVLALSFFGISIQAVVTSPAGQANFAYLLYLLIELWHWFVGLFPKL
jgi:hypothetical protein